MDEEKDKILETALTGDKPQGTERVNIAAGSYEWICPICDDFNEERKCLKVVTCQNSKCRTSFFTNPPDHAMG